MTPIKHRHGTPLVHAAGTSTAALGGPYPSAFLALLKLTKPCCECLQEILAERQFSCRGDNDVAVQAALVKPALDEIRSVAACRQFSVAERDHARIGIEILLLVLH